MGIDDESEREGNCILMVCRQEYFSFFGWDKHTDRYEAGVVLFPFRWLELTNPPLNNQEPIFLVPLSEHSLLYSPLHPREEGVHKKRRIFP